LPEPRPTGITADRKEGTLTITWDDGSSCNYPFDLLRNACPCAECRGGHENMKPEPDDDVFTIPIIDANKTRLENVTPVGNYAISIIWGDGHSYGIYNWHYLYALCQRMRDRVGD
jgi:DUF971 family protein